MRHRPNLRHTAATVCATALLALGLTGCATPTDESEPQSSPTATTEAATPLYEYLSVRYPTFDADRAKADHDRFETVLTTCMTEQGFSYFPSEYVGYTASASETDAEPLEDQSSEAWVAENGYGLSNVQDTVDDIDQVDAPTADANDDYVNSLEMDQMGTYYAAFYGEYVAETETTEPSWETLGCQGAADHAVSGPAEALLERHKPVLDAADALETSILQTPDMLALDAEWGACMTAAGYSSYSTQKAPYDEIFEEVQALYLTDTGMTEDARLEVHGREIPLALADFHCSAEVDYLPEYITLKAGIEDQFVIDHQAELDALVADFSALA